MARRSRKAQETNSTEKRRRIGFHPLYLLLVLGMAFFAYQFIQKTREIQRLQAEAAALQYQNQRISSDNQHIQRSLGYYRTSQYVQNAARAVFGYTMPGDVAIMSRPVHQQIPVVRAAPPAPAAPPSPTWKQWWQAFFG
jgi:cell division protein FtsB